MGDVPSAIQILEVALGQGELMAFGQTFQALQSILG
jgi:hypothetical protein